MNTTAHELATAIYQDLPGEGFTLDQDQDGSWIVTGPTTRLAIGDDEGGLTWTLYADPTEDGGVGGYDFAVTDGDDTTDWTSEQVATFVADMAASLTA